MTTRDPETVLGTPEHAAKLTEGRHYGVQTAMAWLCFSHLPEQLRAAARPFYQTGVELLFAVPTDSAEFTTALNKLVESKDWAVRALIRHQQGKPGPVPRPATVLDPPAGNFGVGQARLRPIRDNPQA